MFTSPSIVSRRAPLKDFRELIADRREGRTHSPEDIAFLARAAAQGLVPDYQLSAWLMAAYLKPLSLQETTELTLAMADSGERLDLSSLPSPHVDKHSTGGVGDKTTLVLLPLLASCGLCMVKMSGAGLGITGGTVDKLASIPGFNLSLSPAQMVDQARRIGIALSGQTPQLAPADKALYALRDATATTGSIPLIVSSILSKKVAGGAEIVVIDVKCGSGGFMPTLENATELSKALVSVGEGCGLKVQVEITDMSEPLGSAVGNALEVQEAILVLSGADLCPSSVRFRELVLELGARTLMLAGISHTRESARELVEQKLVSGEALAKAEQWIAAQGGPSSSRQILASLPKAPSIKTVRADRSGFIEFIDAAEVGEMAVELGAGRRSKDDLLEYSAGIQIFTPTGHRVQKEEKLATVSGVSDEVVDRISEPLRNSIRISTNPVRPRPLFLVRDTGTHDATET